MRIVPVYFVLHKKHQIAFLSLFSYTKYNLFSIRMQVKNKKTFPFTSYQKNATIALASSAKCLKRYRTMPVGAEGLSDTKDYRTIPYYTA